MGSIDSRSRRIDALTPGTWISDLFTAYQVGKTVSDVAEPHINVTTTIIIPPGGLLGPTLTLTPCRKFYRYGEKV